MSNAGLVEMEQHASKVECKGSQGKIAHTLRVFAITAPHFVVNSALRLIPKFLRLDPMINDTNIRAYGDEKSLADINEQLPKDIATVTEAVNKCNVRCDDYTQCKIHKVITR